jgi:hypothetical protein
VGVPRTVKLTWSTSSQAVWAWVSGGGLDALLVSPFNVKWRCSAQAGGVEGSKFCLFSVVLPVRCVSSISLNTETLKQQRSVWKENQELVKRSVTNESTWF